VDAAVAEAKLMKKHKKTLIATRLATAKEKARASKVRFRPKVDGFVPGPEDVNLGIVRQEDLNSLFRRTYVVCPGSFPPQS
jgi:hypothetical protein